MLGAAIDGQRTPRGERPKLRSSSSYGSSTAKKKPAGAGFIVKVEPINR